MKSFFFQDVKIKLCVEKYSNASGENRLQIPIKLIKSVEPEWSAEMENNASQYGYCSHFCRMVFTTFYDMKFKPTFLNVNGLMPKMDQFRLC